MLCTENEMCTWPSDSCITVLRVKSADYKCRKKEWNELKKLSLHGDAVQRGLSSSFVNLVSIEEKCNGDQVDVCAVPISPWEQDSCMSLSICSEDDWRAPRRSLSSTQIEMDSDHIAFEKCCKLVLKKSTSSPSLFEKKPSKESRMHLSEEDLSNAINNNECIHCQVNSYSGGSRRENLNTADNREQDDAADVALLSSPRSGEIQLHDKDKETNPQPNETSELLNERDDSTSSLSPVYILIRSCFPFLFRTRVLRD